MAYALKLLKVFEEATQEVSGYYASASVIIPLYVSELLRKIFQKMRMTTVICL